MVFVIFVMKEKDVEDAVQWIIDRYKEGKSHQQIRLRLIEAGYNERQIERLFIKAFATTRRHPIKEEEVPLLRRYGISFFVGGIFGLLFATICRGDINTVSAIGCLFAGVCSHRITLLKKTEMRYGFFENLGFVVRAGAIAGGVYWLIFLVTNATINVLIWLVVFMFLGGIGAGLSYVFEHKYLYA